MNAKPADPQRVFVSYSRQQFYFAESLALHLQKEGIATWFDVQRLEPGSDWAESIQKGLMVPLALAALVAAGLMQFIAVGMALDRRVTSEVLAAVLVASLVAMGASGRWDLFALLQSGIFIFAFWRACTDWLPVDSPQKPSGPTLALPARKIWTRHLLFVGAIVLFFVLPFGLVAALVP